MTYECSSINKIDEFDMVKSRKNARSNQDLQYKSLNQQMMLDLIKISMEKFRLINDARLNWVFNLSGQATLGYMIIFMIIQKLKKLKNNFRIF